LHHIANLADVIVHRIASHGPMLFHVHISTAWFCFCQSSIGASSLCSMSL